MTPHPCQTCGACCAFFRVEFYWRESSQADLAQRAVPAHLTEKLDETFQIMRGTEGKHSRACVAFQGRIGTSSKCTIYENRPTPCRAFGASYEDWTKNPRCDEARAQHGLPPLTRASWPSK